VFIHFDKFYIFLFVTKIYLLMSQRFYIFLIETLVFNFLSE